MPEANLGNARKKSIFLMGGVPFGRVVKKQLISSIIFNTAACSISLNFTKGTLEKNSTWGIGVKDDILKITFAFVSMGDLGWGWGLVGSVIVIMAC